MLAPSPFFFVFSKKAANEMNKNCDDGGEKEGEDVAFTCCQQFASGVDLFFPLHPKENRQ
jgi:hypothetical protein